MKPDELETTVIRQAIAKTTGDVDIFLCYERIRNLAGYCRCGKTLRTLNGRGAMIRGGCPARRWFNFWKHDAPFGLGYMQERNT